MVTAFFLAPWGRLTLGPVQTGRFPLARRLERGLSGRAGLRAVPGPASRCGPGPCGGLGDSPYPSTASLVPGRGDPACRGTAPGLSADTSPEHFLRRHDGLGRTLLLQIHAAGNARSPRERDFSGSTRGVGGPGPTRTFLLACTPPRPSVPRLRRGMHGGHSQTSGHSARPFQVSPCRPTVSQTCTRGRGEANAEPQASRGPVSVASALGPSLMSLPLPVPQPPERSGWRLDSAGEGSRKKGRRPVSTRGLGLT